MLIVPSQWRPQAWKNGLGTTFEVLRLPDVDDYDVRISVAEVTVPGPFSTFPGYTRWSFLLDGGPVWLGEQRLTRLLQIDGNAAIEARVEAPARLLNVIGRGIRVGVGEAEADIVFDLETHETRAEADIVFDLETHETRVFDEPTLVNGVWIKR
jgi:environmental stress-induced protein Ves